MEPQFRLFPHFVSRPFFFLLSRVLRVGLVTVMRGARAQALGTAEVPAARKAEDVPVRNL